MSQMLYKCPGSHAIHGGKFDYTIVDEADIEATIAAGWFLTTPEAKAAFEASQAVATEAAIEATEATQPTYDELLQKAEEIGLTLDKRWGDARIQREIDAKLKA